jgi:ABC-type glycerol-3-phosphate transport system permease component
MTISEKAISTASPSEEKIKSRLIGVKWGHRLTVLLTYLLLILGGIILMIPFFYMLTTSLKTIDEVMKWPIQWIPSRFMWSNYPEVFQKIPFARFLSNSIVISLGGIIGSVVSCSLAGFGFARLKFPGRNVLFFIMLTTLMLPTWVVIVPHFMIFNWVGWLDTYLPIIVPAFFGNAFYIFLFRQFFLGIPKELEDAARIDGCSTFRMFLQIFMPMSKPTIATVSIFAFFYYWNDLVYPLVYLRSQLNFPVSLGMRMFQTQNPGVVDYPRLMACAVMTLLPCVVLFFSFQSLYIQGVVMTGVEK